ncbi:MAG TPA: hypothetical protein PKE16_06535, partial [Hyphomicrobium sp.]|nr:hypothetical protein [Hyphomicrobium sp.]
DDGFRKISSRQRLAHHPNPPSRTSSRKMSSRYHFEPAMVAAVRRGVNWVHRNKRLKKHNILRCNAPK